MYFFTTIANFRFYDIVDIVLLTALAYHLFLWFRGTKAVKALIGLLGLGVVYVAAKTWGLFLTTWAFQILFQVVVILLIVIFQSEIRQVLEKVNPLQVFGLHKGSHPEKWIGPFSEGIFALAEKKIGALVIIERDEKILEFLAEGQMLESEPSPEILMSIFQKESPIHDGAIVIQKGRIRQVACYLPLSSSQGLPKQWGTRHRAALGLSEKSDAWVVVVSEERGHVSVARKNKMPRVKNSGDLSRMLLEAVAPVVTQKKSWLKRMISLFANQWQIKGGTLLLVVALWISLAGQQDFETTVTVPLTITNMPPQFEIIEPVKPQVEITIRGLRKDAGAMEENNVMVEIDTSLARLGRRTFSITRDNIRLLSDRINVVNINPTKIKFDLKEKSLKSH
jgi:uncharacterized protein (TIGR00159 family)